MDLLRELKKIPKEEKSLEVFFKISNGVGTISGIGAVSSELVEIDNSGTFSQEISLRSTDFDSTDIASTASFLFLTDKESEQMDECEQDEIEFERASLNTINSLIELLELNKIENDKIKETVYTYRKSAIGYLIPKLTKLEKSTYSFFGEAVDCYLIS